MIEERGRIVKIETAEAEPPFVWVETHRKSTCGACEARNGCGQGLMNRLSPSRNHAYIRAANCYPVSVGDEVTIALPEGAVVTASLLVYLLPLLAMLAGVLAGSLVEAREAVTVMFSLAGLLAGFAGVRWWTGCDSVREQYEPKVLHWHVSLTTSVDS